MKNIAIIPARSGSKGLPDKNIKEMCGKPLIAYTIEAALQSGVFDEVMVSTDSKRYAKIAKEYGANVPFLRSEATSSDTAKSNDAIREVLSNYREQLGLEYDTLCILQPTSPLRIAEDIQGAYRIYEEKNAVSVISVCECEHSPLWSGTLNEECEMNGFIQRNNGNQRQKLDMYYRLNGAIYIMDCKEFEEDDFMYRDRSYAYVMPQDRSIDIDTIIDFKMAETIYKEGCTL